MSQTRIVVAELMGTVGFPVAHRLYGQNFLKIDLISGFPRFGIADIEWHLIGAGLTPPTGFPGVQTWEVDPVNTPGAYLPVLRQLATKYASLIVVSSFAMDDAAQIISLASLKKEFPGLSLVVILHCTRQEYIRNIVAAESGGRAMAPSTQDHNGRTIRWLSLLDADRQWNFIDSYVAVSKEVASSFRLPDSYFGRVMPCTNKVTVIPNGVDNEVYRVPDPDSLRETRRNFGVEGRYVVGTTSGWKQYKGSAIMREILAGYAAKPHNSPDFLFPLLHDYSALALLKDLSAPRLSPLVESRRIHLFFDLAKWEKLPGREAIRDAYEIRFEKLREELPTDLAFTLDACWRGFIHTPSQWLMDLYIRPSIAEAFGRGLWEARLCGVRTVVSDRDGLPCGDNGDVVSLPDDLLLGVDNPIESSIEAARRFMDIIESARNKAGKGSDHFQASSCITIPEMVDRYEKHFMSLHNTMRLDGFS